MPVEPETICVLDDDTSVLKAVGRLLCSAGLGIVAFNEPPLFLQYAETHEISLAIIDIWMPEVNGIEVQRRLRSIAPNTPVIMMTGRDEPALRSAALARGAAACLDKPFEGEILLASIRTALCARS